MQIRLQCIGTAVVVGLRGRLTAGARFEALHRLCIQLNRSPGNTIVVDLAGVDRLDCVGVGELVRLHNCAEMAGGDMRIVGVGRLQRELLEMFRLMEPLNVCSTWEAALRGCEAENGEIRFTWHPPASSAARSPATDKGEGVSDGGRGSPRRAAR